MAPATGETMAVEQPDGASGGPPARLARDPKTGRMLPRATGHPEPPVEEEPEGTETPVEGEDDDLSETPEPEETAVGHATVPIERVNALLAEALRLGLQYHLVEKQPDGTFLLAGQSRTTRRESSDCTCQQCTPQAQQHWICVVCHSGPHDWLMVKPQYERQALKPGGIEGTRHAACSAQCARDYLSTLGRQPSGVPLGRGIDPTLALP